MSSPYLTRIMLTSLLVLGLAGCASANRPISEVSGGMPDRSRISGLGAEGEAHLAYGEYRDALQSYEALLKIEPDNTDAQFGRAEALLGLGKLDDAQQAFSALLEVPPLRARALQGVGIVLLRKGEFAAAEEALQAATISNEFLWRAWNGIGQLNDRTANWAAAELAYRKALETSPKPAVIHNNLGVSYMAQKRYDEAIDSFQTALEFDADFDAAETNRLLAFALAERYTEATFRTDANDEAKALNNAGYVALLKGDYDTAQKFFVRAIEVSPSFYGPAFNNLQVVARMRDAGTTP